MVATTSPRLSIVFLNYNRLSETRNTLQHLKQLLADREDTEVIAVDNGSVDGTGDFLQTQTDWITAICLDSNTGIAGYNEGYRKARGDYILVLDDDSHPVDTQTLDRIIRRFDARPDIGVIACRIENMDGSAALSWHLPEGGESGFSMAFVGCGFAIRRKLFEKIGWYPEEFFLYQNEIEVAIRVLRQYYKIYHDAKCRVVHRCSPVGRTNWRRVYFPTRNTIWIIRRYFSGATAAYLIASRLCMGFIRAAQSGEYHWYFQAVAEGFSAPVASVELSPSVRQQLNTFWRQNSLWHQLIGRIWPQKIQQILPVSSSSSLPGINNSTL